MSAKKSDAAISLFDGARTIEESLYKAGTTDKPSNVAACDVKLGEADFVRLCKAFFTEIEKKYL